MYSKTSVFGAIFALLFVSVSTHAGLIKNAGKASTSNTTTTTSGQRSILMTVDPYNISSFQLDVSFEASKVQFVGIVGLNGYIIDDDFNVITDGNTGFITDIHGYFPGFNDRIFTPITTDSVVEGPLPPNPPAGEVDIFQVEFLVLRPDLDKTFGVFASSNDYIKGFDPDTGGMTTASGPVNSDGFGVAPAFSTVPGIPNGGSSAPLPGALAMGLVGGIGVLANVVRRRKA